MPSSIPMKASADIGPAGAGPSRCPHIAAAGGVLSDGESVRVQAAAEGVRFLLLGSEAAAGGRWYSTARS